MVTWCEGLAKGSPGLGGWRSHFHLFHAGLLPAVTGGKILPSLPPPVTCVSRDILTRQVAWPLVLEAAYLGTESLYLAF